MFKHLQLRRPIVFLDVAATGANPWHDRIIEIGMFRYPPHGRCRSTSIRLNPGLPIPEAAFAMHGLADEHVKDCLKFAQRASDIQSFIGDADLAGFNIARFDLPILVAEFRRAARQFTPEGRHVIDAMKLFHLKEPRDLAAAARLYCKAEHHEGHDARADAVASARILDAIVGRHEELPCTTSGLDHLLNDVDIEGWFCRDGHSVVFARGQHQGRTLADVAASDAPYLGWLRERAMPDVHRIIDQVCTGSTDAS